MDQDNYQYDVAFSFLAEDEAFATELNDLLQDRLSTFLYSKKQEKLAGTDGEEKFNAVFGEEARFVVVLYREGWGETPWTRIEQTAIRNRAYDKGYGFVKFVSLDESASMPKWLPKTQLWMGLNRWGISGAASVIEARVQELGGLSHEESVEGRAKRLERALNFERKREQFHNSQEGVNLSEEAFTVLGDEIERLVAVIKKTTASISYLIKRTNHQIQLFGSHARLKVNWQYQYTNSLENSELNVELWDGNPSPFEIPRQRYSLTFQFDLLKPEAPGWKSTYPSEREFDSKALAEFILKFYMDDAEPER